MSGVVTNSVTKNNIAAEIRATFGKDSTLNMQTSIGAEEVRKIRAGDTKFSDDMKNVKNIIKVITAPLKKGDEYLTPATPRSVGSATGSAVNQVFKPISDMFMGGGLRARMGY
jgi:hypothetical protein